MLPIQIVSPNCPGDRIAILIDNTFAAQHSAISAQLIPTDLIAISLPHYSLTIDPPILTHMVTTN